MLENLRNICAVVTPFGTDGSIDYVSHERHIKWLEKNEVDAIVSLGTTGESPTISFKEHKQIIKRVVGFSHLPVIAGAGGNSTEEAIQLTKDAEKAGAAAILSVVPYYNKPNQEGIFKHYGKICESTSLPVLLYNVPGRTGVNMEVETVLRLHDKYPNMAGIKEASNNLQAVQRYIQNGVPVYCGEDSLNFAMLCLGARGVISVVSNFAGKTIAELILALAENNLAVARLINNNIAYLSKAAFIDTNPIPTKFIVAKLGFGNNSLRLPLSPLSPEKQRILLEIIKKHTNFSFSNKI
jgi:4-hydroxy-tetrahydrodipicolinate synthase